MSEVEEEEVVKVIADLTDLKERAREETANEDYYVGWFNGKECAYDSAIEKLKNLVGDTDE